MNNLIVVGSILMEEQLYNLICKENSYVEGLSIFLLDVQEYKFLEKDQYSSKISIPKCKLKELIKVSDIKNYVKNIELFSIEDIFENARRFLKNWDGINQIENELLIILIIGNYFSKKIRYS